MIKTFHKFLISFFTFLILPILNAQDITGDWYGMLQRPDSLRITLHISKDRRGLKATWDSPDQEIFGRPVTEMSLKDDTLIFHIARDFIFYKGGINGDFSMIDGKWSEEGGVSELDFGRTKLLRTLMVDTSSLVVRPVKTRAGKAGFPINFYYKVTGVTKAGIPEVIKIDTSKLKVLTPGKNTVSYPVIYKFPEPVTEMEFHYQSDTFQHTPIITRAVQPIPIPAKPMRMRDVASLNIQFLDVDKTLSFQEIRTILEDSKGNIWFGSNTSGICKYDGKSFTHYTAREGFTGLQIRGMIEDRSGNIWIGTDRGVCKYDGQSFTLFSGGVIRNILSSLEAENGDLWFGSSEGLFARKGNVWIQYTVDQGLTSNIVNSLIEDNEGNLWIGTDGGGVCSFNGESFTHFAEKDGLLSNNVLSGFKDRYGNLWFGTNRGICKYDGNSFRQFTTDQGLSNNVITTIVEDSYGILWFGTENHGVNIYDGNTFTHLTQKEGLSSNEIRWIMKDHSNSLWFGTRLGGLMKFHGGSFTYFTQFESISHSPVAAITEDRSGNIWFGLLGQGLVKYDGESFFEVAEEQGLDDIFIRYFIYGDKEGNIWFNNDLGLHRYDGDFFTQYFDSEVSETTSLNLITSMYEDTEGFLWLGTWGKGLLKTDGEYVTSFPQVSRGYVTSVLRDYKGNVWYGTASNGLMKYNGVSITKYSVNEGLSGYYVNSLCEDESGNLWIGTKEQGLTMYDGESFRHFTEKDGLCNNDVRSITGDHKGRIWVGTKNGLSLFSPQEDRKYSITSFGPEDGLKEISFNNNSICLDHRNRIWWGTGDEVTMLDLDAFELAQAIPEIHLNTIYLNQQYIDFYKLLSENEEASDTMYAISRKKMHRMKFSGVALFHNYPLDLVLPHYLNHLTFNFIATEWTAPQSIQYQYMLEGLDEQWSSPSVENQADYRNIPSGDYTFKVKAISKAGIWSDTFEYPFIIRRPWWFRWWAYIFYAFALILVARYYIRYIISRERIQAEIQIKQVEVEKMQELDKLKSRFFASVSHEFRTPLTLLLGPVEDLLKRGKDEISVGKDILEMMKRNGKRLQRLINQLLDISKLETGKVKLHVSEGNLEEQVRTLVNSFLSLAESKEIRYECNLPETNRTVYFDRDKLEKILTNLISNAFKFTPAEGEIVVNLQYVKTIESDTPQYVEMKVIDTGMGIPEEMAEKIFDRFYRVSDSKVYGMEGTGIGLALTKELVDLYRGEIHVESKPGEGSTFIVKLPVSRELFKDEEIVERTSDKEEKVEPVIKGTGFEETEGIKEADSELQEEAKDTPVILIVEDNTDLRNYISGILRNSYQIMVSGNGKEGLDSTIETIPDLVISDLMMPEMDGMEMCQKLKSDERTDHIPVILLTARADRGSKLEGLETGADDYLVKPFDAEELKVRIRNLIKQRKNLKDKFRKELVSEEKDLDVSYEDKILNKLMGILDNYVAESEFNIDQLADELHMSRTQVFRKVNALTGYTPNDLLRNLRLKKAASMFRSGHKHIAQVMHQVGFNNQSWFGKCFHELYGLTPSEYIKQKRNF